MSKETVSTYSTVVIERDTDGMSVRVEWIDADSGKEEHTDMHFDQHADLRDVERSIGNVIMTASAAQAIKKATRKARQ